YSAMRTKLGEVMVSATPRPAPNALAKCVLPAPRSPHRQTRSPGSATRASARPRRLVASGSGQWTTWVAGRTGDIGTAEGTGGAEPPTDRQNGRGRAPR